MVDLGGGAKYSDVVEHGGGQIREVRLEEARVHVRDLQERVHRRAPRELLFDHNLTASGLTSLEFDQLGRGGLPARRPPFLRRPWRHPHPQGRSRGRRPRGATCLQIVHTL